MLLNRLFRRIKTEFSIYLPIKIEENVSDVIISLTSYPARLSKLHIVIKSLLRQKYQPSRIYLYLGTDTKDSDIPQKLRKLEQKSKGLFEIKTGYEDLKPHKKYFFVMQENPESIVITVDDDLIYDCNLVKDLYESYKIHYDCVSSRRVNFMTKTDNKINSYTNWKWEFKNELEPSFSLLPTGCGGVLYPPHILPKETFNSEAIKKYCLNTDDIWLKFMELKNNVKVVFTNSKVIHPLTLRGSQKSALMHTNAESVSENRNDINIRKMSEFTGLNLADYC